MLWSKLLATDNTVNQLKRIFLILRTTVTDGADTDVGAGRWVLVELCGRVEPRHVCLISIQLKTFSIAQGNNVWLSRQSVAHQSASHAPSLACRQPSGNTAAFPREDRRPRRQITLETSWNEGGFLSDFKLHSNDARFTTANSNNLTAIT